MGPNSALLKAGCEISSFLYVICCTWTVTFARPRQQFSVTHSVFFFFFLFFFTMWKSTCAEGKKKKKKEKEEKGGGTESGMMSVNMSWFGSDAEAPAPLNPLSHLPAAIINLWWFLDGGSVFRHHSKLRGEWLARVRHLDGVVSLKVTSLYSVHSTDIFLSSSFW